MTLGELLQAAAATYDLWAGPLVMALAASVVGLVHLAVASWGDR